MPAPKASPELNYSADDINCRYSLIQDSLGVSGDSVIIGIIDLGLDWLHEDFIDSNGNTRIRYFWDQTDQTGPNPTYPSCSIGTEFSYSTINGFIQTSQPGRDYHGHGTHVSGIAAGNNRSGGSQSFVGVAPEANIILVKYDIPDHWPNAIEYIAFNSSTVIEYAVPYDGHVVLDVYNILGQKVVNLVDGYRRRGDHTILWDGRNSLGRDCASGIYFCRLKTGRYEDTRTMVMVR
jgi:hypothetical protein